MPTSRATSSSRATCFTGLAELDGLADPARGPGSASSTAGHPGRGRSGRRCGWASSGRRHGRRPRRSGWPAAGTASARDARAMSHHYDVGNDFYELVLGPSMIYSCAYFEQAPSAGYTLEDAQRAKLDLVARKLGLTPGMRVLDVGCGWGSFAIHAAREYGVHGRRRHPFAGAGRLRPRTRAPRRAWTTGSRSGCRTTATCADGPYDAIASIGMAEHVGLLAAGRLRRRPARAAAPRGPAAQPRDLAAARTARPSRRQTSFIDRYVFPDGELAAVGDDGRRARGRRASRSATSSPCGSTTPHAARLGGQPRSGLGRGGRPDQRRPGPGVAALHGRLRARVRGQPARRQPGARRPAGRPRAQRRCRAPGGRCSAAEWAPGCDRARRCRLRPALARAAGATCGRSRGAAAAARSRPRRPSAGRGSPRWRRRGSGRRPRPPR